MAVTDALALLAALLLGDGRFPAGGHAHSAGAEAACADGRIVDEAALAAFVEGRVRTIGLVDAALAAATVLALAGAGARGGGAVAEVLTGLDAEAEARIAVPVLREASRRLGRQLQRVAGRCWPDPVLVAAAEAVPDGLHQPVALGAVGAAAGLGVDAVAALAVHHTLTTPAQAAVRLLGLDPFGVAAVTARLAPVAADVAEEAVAAAEVGDPAALPAFTSPLVDIAAIEHRTWDVRMFAT